MGARSRKTILIASVVLGIALVLSLVVYEFSRIRPPETEGINREYILNFLEYYREQLKNLPDLSHNYIWTLDSYDILEMNVPNRTEVIAYLDTLQGPDGTWGGTNMYLTSQVLMFYGRSGVKPAKSLEPFFSTVDTWDEIVSFVLSHGGNYWGYLYLIINSYVVYKGEAPPWTNEFLAEVNEKFDTWAYDNHQRTHLIGNLLELRKPIPRIDEVINITLRQQNGDGSWDSSEAETGWAIQVLSVIRNQTTIDKNLIDFAIRKGLEYIKKCYKTVDLNGKTYAGFAAHPAMQYPTPKETAVGIWVLLNPESDIWSRWFITA